MPPAAGHAGEPGARTWTSGLSTGEFACLRAVGFEPVVQVMGASVYTLGISALYAARRAAMREMSAQCQALGGDGVIAVHVEIGPFRGDKRTLAFQVNGTAVRARGDVRPPWQFTSDLSAQEFAKLIGSGWVPMNLVLGAAMSTLPELHFTGRRARRLLGGLAADTKIDRWSGVVTRTRQEARHELRRLAGRSADGIVISRYDLEVHELFHRRVVEARFLGTAIAGFGASPPPREPTELEIPLPALRLPPDPPSVTTRTESVLRLSTDEPDGP